MVTIQLHRVYDSAPRPPGPAILVERLWPRGLHRAEVAPDGWHKELAPSSELRRWFGHDPGKWSEFRRRYFAELDARPAAWQALLDEAGHDPGAQLVLLYSARDREHNNAAALRDYLLARQAGQEPAV